MVAANSWLERLARDAEQLECFTGFSLIKVKSFVETALSQIGKEGIFWQFTDHSIKHIDAIIALAEELLPESERAKMTPADALLLTLALYFHDLGMVVTRKEYDARNSSDFVHLREELIHQYSASGKAQLVRHSDFDRQAYEEYVRTQHAIRIRKWVTGQNDIRLGDATDVVAVINEVLGSLDPKFREHLGVVCESHHLDDLDAFAKYPVEFAYGRTAAERANVHYAALMLRTADLLHATRDRTPSVAYRLIAPNHPFSIQEWKKQQGVISISSLPGRNALNEVDEHLPRTTIGVTARFSEPEVFFSFTQYLDYVRKQLQQTYKWSELAKRREGARLEFAWQNVDDSRVEIVGYLRHDSRFTLDQDRILSLLTGHTLYNDSAVAIREVLQNAIDAVRLQHLAEPMPGGGSIEVLWDNSNKILSVRDSGTGMTLDVVRDYLLNVGRSRYQDKELREQFPQFSPISRFGIGILSTFMIADEVEITTVSPDGEKGLRLLFRDVHSRYLIKELDKAIDPVCQQIGSHGTEVKLHLRADAKPLDPRETLRTAIYFPPCNVRYIDHRGACDIGSKSAAELLVAMLAEFGVTALRHSSEAAPPEPYEVRVFSVQGDNYDIAYACKWWNYYNEWTFYWPTIGGQRGKDLKQSLGTCVEGIFVEPGFVGLQAGNIFAIVNLFGRNAPKTNVARNALEYEGEGAAVVESAIAELVAHVSREALGMIENHGATFRKAIAECVYLARPLIEMLKKEQDRNRVCVASLYEALLGLPFVIVDDNEGRLLKSGLDFLESLPVALVLSPLVRAAEDLLALSKSKTGVRELLHTLDKSQPKLPEGPLFVSSGQGGELEAMLFQHMEISRLEVHQQFNRVDVTWVGMEEFARWYQIPHEWTSYGQSISQELQQRSSRANTWWVPMSGVTSMGGDNIFAVELRGARYYMPNNPLTELMRKHIKDLFFSAPHGASAAMVFWILLEMFVTDVYSPAVGDTVEALRRRVADHCQRIRPGAIEPRALEIINQELLDALAKSPSYLFDPASMSRIA